MPIFEMLSTFPDDKSECRYSQDMKESFGMTW
jgi:hypothetical protein